MWAEQSSVRPSELLADTKQEIVLEAALVISSDTAWCEAGHIVSVGQTVPSRPEQADTFQWPRHIHRGPLKH